MASSTALFALGAGLSALGSTAGAIGNRIDLINAPDQKRFQGNSFLAILQSATALTMRRYRVGDLDRVAETLEKTGYRVDETIHCYRLSLPVFISDLRNRRYWLPVQMSATFEGIKAPLSSDEKDDLSMRFANGVRFHFDLSKDIGKDLAYDNVEE